MNNLLNHITSELGDSICSQFDFYERKNKLYLISPFYHDDGDGLHIVVKKDDNEFIVSDEGHSIMRLSYDLSMNQINNGQRKEVIDSLRGHYGIEDRLGEYLIKTSGEKLADALFRMIHFCIRIEDVEFLSQDRTPNTFVKDFKRESNIVFGEKAEIDWFDMEHDERGDYPVDIMLNNSGRCLGIFPMYTNHQIMSNTITIHTLRQWGHSFNYLGVVQERDNVSDSSIKKFVDASDNIYFLNGQSNKVVFSEVRSLLSA